MTLYSFHSKTLLFFLLALFTVFSSSCVTSSKNQQQASFEGSWEAAGLEEISVNSFNKFDQLLYAATDSGLYTRELPGNSWEPSGLQEEEILNIVFLPDNNILAAIRIPDFSEGISSLFISSNNDQNWRPYMHNFGGETGEYTWIGSLSAISNPSDTLIAQVGATTVVRSTDGGRNWKVVNGAWNLFGGAAVLVYVDRHHNGRVWAGGVTGFSFPYLLKSIDSGESWMDLETLGTSSQVCYDIATHPRKKEEVLAGLSGSFDEAQVIRKTTDEGETWSTVFDKAGIFALANSKRNPEIVYASGLNSEGTLFFTASPDFGDTWQTIEYTDGPVGIQVNDMVSVMVGGQEVLYLGTNKGIYRYVFEE